MTNASREKVNNHSVYKRGVKLCDEFTPLLLRPYLNCNPTKYYIIVTSKWLAILSFQKISSYLKNTEIKMAALISYPSIFYNHFIPN